MREPGEVGPFDEAIAYRLILMGLHADDPMGYAAMEDMFDGGKQRVANVIQVLTGIALTGMLQNHSPEEVARATRQAVAEKTLAADREET